MSERELPLPVDNPQDTGLDPVGPDPETLEHAVLAAVALELQRMAAEAESTQASMQLSNLAKLVGWAIHAPLESLAAEHEPEVHAADDVPEDAREEQIGEYLRGRYPAESVEVVAVQEMYGGLSKHTIMVEFRHRAANECIVVRQSSHSPDPGTLIAEYDVLKWAWSAGLPIAEPLWLEAQPNLLGGPFLVSRRAAGRNLGDVWGSTTVPPRHLCEQLAQILSALHAAPTHSLSTAPAAPMTDEAEIEDAISRQERRAEAANGLGKRLARLFEWLRGHAPAPSEHSALLHGDVGFHNLLVEDAAVTALLDWERSHFGDPAEDLVYVRPSIESAMDWHEFLDTYAEAGGRPPARDALRFYAVWQDVWRHVACLRLAADFVSSRRYSAGVAGFVNGPRFLDSAERAAADHDL
jgi:aminoglycoside phosphotransferase (APT) family kinase protein